MDAARKRFVPVSVQALAGERGQRRSLNPGNRTSVPRGIQSPDAPSAETTRASTGPKAEEPKRVRGARLPMAVFASSSISPPSASESTVRKLESTAATSTFSLRGKFDGSRDLRKNTRRPSSGRSSRLPSRTGEAAAASSCVPLLSNSASGRGVPTVTGTFNSRPSRSATLASYAFPGSRPTVESELVIASRSDSSTRVSMPGVQVTPFSVTLATSSSRFPFSVACRSPELRVRWSSEAASAYAFTFTESGFCWPNCRISSVTGPGSASCIGTLTSSVSGFGDLKASFTGLPVAACSSTRSTQRVLSPTTCTVSSRPTTSADWSPGASVHLPSSSE